MKHNWKAVAQGTGYKSLKAAYMDDVQKSEQEKQKNRYPMRDKAEFRRKFEWVIKRAIHYAHHQKKPLGLVLYRWETERGRQWWLNYYQDCNQPRFIIKVLKPVGIKGIKKYYRKQGYSAELSKREVCRRIVYQQGNPKKRWLSHRKKRGY